DDNEQYVYRYDSTGNCTLLLTNIVSHGGVIHDVATDREGNFYLFFTNDQIIRAYDPSGIPVDSFTTTGFPAGPNCGFTILGDRLYGLTCNGADGLYEGIKSGNNIAFTLIKTLTGAFGYYMDLASCPSAAKPIAVFETPGKPDFIIYPNPARERATIKFDNTITLEISNNLGVLLETISVRGLSEYHLDVSKWKEGVYFVNAMSSNNLSTRAAFVIQHP
ncbi:MAG TPA: T9SS type A sorting domain-containing protein, partial [Bacteroidia bacterium]|nr:T9SS type A sorting domain-containing protein [Bacteroidia bacterium]